MPLNTLTKTPLSLNIPSWIETYQFNIHNSVTHTTVDLEEEDFSKSASLMRGILIMSKIFHSFDIDRDEEKQIVSLKGEITIS